MSEFEQDLQSTGSGSGPPAAGASTSSPAANAAAAAVAATSASPNASRLRATQDGNAVRRGDSDDMDDEMEDSGSSDQSADSLANEVGRGDSNSSPPTDSSSPSQQLGTSSSGASSTSPPVRRLPSVLRPPPVNASSGATTANTGTNQSANASPSRNAMNTSNTSNENAAALRQLYGSGNTPTGNSGTYASSSSSSPGNGASAVLAMRSSHAPQYYAHAASSSVESPSMSRGYGHDQNGHDQMLPSPTNGGGSSTQLGGQSSSASALNQSVRSGLMTSSPREIMDVDGGSGAMMRGQKRRLGQYDPRYTSDHHTTSNSGNAAMNRQQQQQQQQQMANQYQYQQQLQQQQQLHHMEDDDDDDVGGGSNSATMESSTSRGSHGPRDALRYETWTSKQLRKKCSHLKLRGLKNVKKHVMVDALYRYYRNQRQKELTGGGSEMTNKGTTGAVNNNNSSSNNSNDQPQSQQSRLRGDMQPMGGGYNNRGSHRYEHSGSSASSSVATYPSSNNAAIYRSRASSGNSNNNSNANSVSDRTSNSHLNSSSSSLATTRGKQSSAMSSTKPTPQIVRHQRAHLMAYDDIEQHNMDMLDGNEEQRQNQPHHHDMLDNEIHVTSEDVIRLVDVVLSPVFVDRLAVELSRWQFWVDVRERYIAMLNNSTGVVSSSYASGSRSHYHMLTGSDMVNHRGASMHGNRSGLVSSRNFKWSSMQLWEIWKELTFAYTKTCFEFTAAGSDERDYINFCEGRPDVYYLHQRLHARPDLLHLIKSNEYIEEKVTSDASESIAAAQAAAAQDVHNSNSAVQMLGSGASPLTRGGHKRFKRIVPAPNQANVVGVGLGPAATSASGAPVSNNVTGGNAPNSNGNGPSASGSQPLGNATVRRGVASSRDFLVDSSENSPSNGEGGSTENSETTGEDGSMGMKSSITSQNASSDITASLQYREVLAEQKYFGLLLQNFEAIFESLHNKKVLLAALRKDSNAPDHMVADLHDDIHVLSALKKEFRNKLRNTLR